MAFLIPSPEISTAKILFNPNPNPRILKSLTLLRNDERVGYRTKVRTKVGIKDGEFRVSGRNQNVRLYGQFSAPVKEETKQSKEEKEKQNYYVNMGVAIRTLREEFPELFYRELSFDIYRFEFYLFIYFLNLFNLSVFASVLFLEFQEEKGKISDFRFCVSLVSNNQG